MGLQVGFTILGFVCLEPPDFLGLGASKGFKSSGCPGSFSGLGFQVGLR